MVILKVSGVLAMGSLAGVEPVKNALIAAGVGVLEVLEELSKSYMNDGYISDAEINAAFAAQATVQEPSAPAVVAEPVAEEENLG
jgi:hypothetical protein